VDPCKSISEQIEKISGYILKSAQDSFIHRPNSFETFGLDFMIDEDLNVNLIECNRSPDLSFSTAVTTHLSEK